MTDSDVAADSDEGMQPTRIRASQSSSIRRASSSSLAGRPGRSARRCVQGSEDENGQGNEDYCFLCEEEIMAGEEKLVRGKKFHQGPCHNVCRAARRADSDYMDNLMSTDPAAWRKVAQPMLRSRGTKDYRPFHDLKTEIARMKVKVHTKTKQRVAGRLKLNKVRAISFLKMWERMGSSEAES